MENRREFSHSGICHVICECRSPELPSTPAGTRMKKTLTEIQDALMRSAEASLPALSEAYEKNSDPHKRLRHRPLLLSLQLDCEEKKRFILLSIRLQLSRCGRTLEKKEGAARFDKQSGHLLGRAKFNF